MQTNLIIFCFQLHLHNLKLDRQTTNDRLTKLELEVGSIKHILSGNTFQSFSQIPPSNLVNEQIKRSNLNLSYGVMNSSDNYDESFNVKRYVSQSPPRRHDNEGDDECFDGSHVIQLEKDTLKLRRELQDAIASKKSAESRILAYVF